ncbi:MAG: excinuclease ABC subunit UvrA, partial [Bacteroidales bacterium]|nr:excinuclease ABC subunit UvrA [Bacteroidales bacterium]
DGLHTKDIRHIIRLFDALVDRGNTVWLIEHNLDVIRSADWLVELGPGAGEDGGRVLYAGPPAGVRNCEESVTKDYL